jgi:hypothetical protein
MLRERGTAERAVFIHNVIQRFCGLGSVLQNEPIHLASRLTCFREQVVDPLQLSPAGRSTLAAQVSGRQAVELFTGAPPVV